MNLAIMYKVTANCNYLRTFKIMLYYSIVLSGSSDGLDTRYCSKIQVAVILNTASRKAKSKQLKALYSILWKVNDACSKKCNYLLYNTVHSFQKSCWL